MSCFPFLANGGCTTQNNTCQSFNGCYLTSLMGTPDCSECDSGYYNNDSTGITDNCTQCPNSYNEPGKIPNISAQTPGQSECPWMCDVGYFKSITNQSNNQAECLSCPDTSQPVSYGTQDITNIGTCTCPTGIYLIETTESNVDKYYCGTCGVGTPSNTGNIKTCTCPATSNQVHGNQTYKTISNMLVECACPDYANWDNNSNRCKCSANKYLHQDNNGVYSCISCPSNGNCPEGSTWESATCATGYKKVPNTTNHTFTCESCSDSNATLYGNVCKCNAGYYGPQNDLNTECEQCPIGTTTTTIGATQRNECKMNHNTKFCYGSGDNKKCMNLIPAGTVISVSNNT